MQTEVTTPPQEDLSLDLIPSDNPLLREEIEPFDFNNPPEDPIKIAHILSQSILKHPNSLGLSCPQIGLRHRAFVMKANPMIVVFNPIIVDISEEWLYAEEGCLSFPNLFIKIKRPQVIKVRYQHPNSEKVTCIYQDRTARIFQHELDHLDGVLFQDRANDIHLMQARNKLKKRLRGQKRQKQET